ncbi:MAG TPA: NTP transferase domain-containing protein, partial [Sphingomonas sp.]|nr:NTP transferase domain-containing protein [Sphingomonas sp.]
MIAAEDTILVLLAAGLSSRFGAANKLAQDFLGKPLGLHVATALSGVAFARRIAIIDGAAALDYAAHGFDMIRN